MMSAALSDCGNTRLPRSVLSATPRLSKKSITSAGPKPPSAEYRKRGLTGTLRRTSCTSQLLHTLQRPLPVINSLRPTFSLVSSSVTCALLRGSTCRHQTGCAAADYDNVQFISSSGFFIYVVFFPDALQLIKCMFNLIAAAHADSHDQCVDDRQGRHERIDKARHIAACEQHVIGHTRQRRQLRVGQRDNAGARSRAYFRNNQRASADAEQHITRSDTEHLLKNLG